MDDSCKEKILFEIGKIDNLVEKSSVLLEKSKLIVPDFIEVNAVGSILHSFYNGVENIFKLLYKDSGGKPLSAGMWHSELFAEMFKVRKNNFSILNSDLLIDLKDFLGFRHVFRHSYGYELDWMRLEPLFYKMNSVWKRTKECILNYIELDK